MKISKVNLPVKLSMALCAVAVIGLSNPLYAANHGNHGPAINNGTTDELVEAYVAPAGRCAAVQCDGWVKASDSLPVRPNSDGGMLMLPEKAEGSACAWDLKVATQRQFSGEASVDHMFRNVDMCRKDSSLSIIRASAGVFAVQSFTDEQGRADRIAIPSQTSETLWVDPDYIKNSGDSGVGSMFYNGLSGDITGVQVARADQCDSFICGQFQPRAENQMPLKPQGGIGALALRDDICKIDMQITSLTGADGASQMNTFKAVDLCAPPNKRSAVSFVQTINGMFAVQMFEDAVGQVQRIVYIAD